MWGMPDGACRDNAGAGDTGPELVETLRWVIRVGHWIGDKVSVYASPLRTPRAYD